MRIQYSTLCLFVIISTSSCAQNKGLISSPTRTTTSTPKTFTNLDTMPNPLALPYAEIPQCPDSYTATAVVARMIDGLGFRYYWATETLREIDLSYRPDSTARTSFETMEHLLGLSQSILNAVTEKPNIRPFEKLDKDWPTLRRETLENLKQASEVLRRSADIDLEKCEVIFQRGDKTSSFPFWHMINGQIADALWHTGQVVSFRRASGNPIDNRVNVFMGNLRFYKPHLVK